jgi:hypothetical protein
LCCLSEFSGCGSEHATKQDFHPIEIQKLEGSGQAVMRPNLRIENVTIDYRGIVPKGGDLACE